MKFILCLSLLFLAGCGGAKPPANQEPAAAKPIAKASIDPATASVIQGKVRFTGQAPVMPKVDMSANPACERLNKLASAKPRREESVVLNPNGTLSNTFVWIAAGLPEARWDPPAEFAQLDQQGCVYTPHVLGLMVGQTLEISNSDTVNHNVHADSTVNAAWNVNEPPRAEKRRERFSKQEIMIPVTCGVHPWMRGYLAVVAHPFFAVTGADGSFSIKGVPPGRYTLEAVHEKFGKRETQIEVGASQTKDVDFRFSAGASN